MLTTRFRSLALALVVPAAGLGILAALNRVTTAQVSEKTKTQRALSEVSRITGIPASRLTVAKEAPLADTGITRFKLRDTQGKIHGVSLDASGHPVSQEALQQTVQAIANQGFAGKLEAELADLLRHRSNNTMRVVFSLNGKTVAPFRSGKLTRAQDKTNLDTIRSQNAAIEQPIVNQLKTHNQHVVYQSPYASIVVADVTPEMLKKMAVRSDVERIYLERVAAPRMNVSRVVVQANTANSRSFTGGGQRVGVVESQRIGSHPNLPAAQRILCRPEASTAISDHKTQVAGVIQSTDATYRGMAPAITIVDGIAANLSDSELIAATDCVISNGASAINLSFGNETNGSFDVFARYVDQVVYNTRRIINVAISNICDYKIGSPDIAFNVLAVGAFGDNNTTGFEGDIAACTGVVNFSAFLDPVSPHNDREEPDIVAPGYQIQVPINGGGFANSRGTSVAAPHVTGGVGLLGQRKSVLSQAEEVRAIMMASARHNIEGSSRLSERDGAGAIMLAAADRVVASGLSKFFSNNGAASNFPINSTFTAEAGQKVRVAIAWAHKMPAGNTMTEPTTDLDLTVKHPNGSVITSSASLDNNYEIVEFTAPVKGTYTAVISNSRPSSGTEYIGFAVSKTNS